MAKCVRCHEVELRDGSICDACVIHVLEEFYAVVSNNRRGRALLKKRDSIKRQIVTLIDKIREKHIEY